eukprot:354306-Chlamydomonas_euryale.AAC.5
MHSNKYLCATAARRQSAERSFGEGCDATAPPPRRPATVVPWGTAAICHRHRNARTARRVFRTLPEGASAPTCRILQPLSPNTTTFRT